MPLSDSGAAGGYHRRVPTDVYPRDRFDDVPRQPGRVGAHRAENPRMRPSVVLMWSALCAVVLFCAGVVGFMVVSQQPGIVAEPEPQSTVAPVMDPSYHVFILNGTASQGLESTAEEQLLAAGWSASDISASNANTTDFPETVVYFASPEHEAAAAGVAEVLGGAELRESDAYAGPEDKTVTVVLGLDRVSAG